MQLVEGLKFLKNFTAKNSSLAALNCIKIDNGQCTATDLEITASAFIPDLVGIVCAVDAAKIVQAVNAAKNPEFRLTETGLVVTSGKFKATVPIQPVDNFPSIAFNDAKEIEINGLILPIIKALNPFRFGDAASLPTIAGIGIDGPLYSATNKAVLAQTSGPDWGEKFILSSACVDVLAKLKTEPVKLNFNPSKIVWWINDTDWMQFQLVAGDYVNTERILKTSNIDDLPEINEEFRAAAKSVADFSDDEFKTLRIDETGIHGGVAFYDIEGMPKSVWMVDKLLPVLEIATHIDLSPYPDPAGWRGNGLRGVVLGVRS